jgi:hypothetical protein
MTPFAVFMPLRYWTDSPSGLPPAPLCPQGGWHTPQEDRDGGTRCTKCGVEPTPYR